MEKNKKSEIIFSEKNILETYPKSSQEIVKQYYKVLELRKSGKRIGSLTISRKLKVPQSRIKNWIYENKKPEPLHILETLKENNLIPLVLDENDEKFLFLVRLCAFSFGDGHIEHKKNGNITRFLFYGKKEDLEVIRRELKIFCKLNSIVEKNAHNKNGYRIKPSGNGGAALARLLVAMGAPIGDKIITPFLLPKWLLNSNDKTISQFLGVLFANELTTPILEKRRSIKAIRFSMNKHEKYINFGIEFMKQIKKLLNNLNVKTTNIKTAESDKRKDGNSYKIYFRIMNNGINLLRFHKNLYFFYAKKKQRKIDSIVNIIKPQFRENLMKIEKYESAMVMKKQFNIGKVKISRILNENTNTVGSWLYQNIQPKYLNDKNEIKELIK